MEPNSDSIAEGIEYALEIDTPIEYEERTWDDVGEEHVAFYHDILDDAA